ncbi:MAG: D-aminoacylase [Balneolales bacterium]
MKYLLLFSLLFYTLAFAAEQDAPYDVIIKNGTIYDGSGEKPFMADIALRGEEIVRIGDLENAIAPKIIDASGRAIAPGFINVLSWAANSLLRDGRSMSDIKQGVTLEVFGEGSSMGPIPGDEQEWNTLDEFLVHLTDKGVSTNVASFVGATTIRQYVLGHADRAPNENELDQMRKLVREAMEDGALGLGTSLIYAPAFFADTEELIELSRVVAEYDGLYISHLRSEGNSFEESVDELLEISRKAGIRAEIFHLKAAGKPNWHKLDNVINKIEAARIIEGLEISANMYTYTAASTSLAAIMPPWTNEGGHRAWIRRLKDPEIRKQIVEEIQTDSDDWENFYLAAGTPDNIIITGLNNSNLRSYNGLTLAQIAEQRDTGPIETAIDLTIEDNRRIGAVYFLMSDENVKRQIQIPWMSFGSDGGSFSDRMGSMVHPRAFGNFARLLGKYVRDEQVIPLEEAIYKMTALPAKNLRIGSRGKLKEGYKADIVIFDPETIRDHATYEDPHQYASGVDHVFVNGVQVLKNGKHTGAKPGQVVRRSSN